MTPLTRKVGRSYPMINRSEFRLGQYRDGKTHPTLSPKLSKPNDKKVPLEEFEWKEKQENMPDYCKHPFWQVKPPVRLKRAKISNIFEQNRIVTLLINHF